MADVEVVEVTDPGCSWAWGSEPKMRMLHHLCGDRVAWRRVLGGLVEDMAAATDGFDPVGSAPRWSRYWKKVAGCTGAPWPVRLTRMYTSTFPACVVAKVAESRGARVADQVLRRLREAIFVFGEPPEDSASIGAALIGIPGLGALIADAGLPGAEVSFRADWEATRNPDPYVIDLDDPGEGSGRAKRDGDRYRYVFPTLVISGPGGRAVVPGWKPLDRYLAALEVASPGITSEPPVNLSPDAYLERWRTATDPDFEIGCGGARPEHAHTVDYGGGRLWLAAAEAEARGL